MAKARSIDPRNLSDRKLWELLRAATPDARGLGINELQGVRRELMLRDQLRAGRCFRQPH